MKSRAAICVFIFLLAACCSSKESDSSLPVTQMTVAGQNFNVEIATSFHDQEVGLMHRDHLDPDHGMIFVMDEPKVQTFWNHDVHFPLDLIFLSPDGTVVSLKHMDAWSEKNTSSDVPAQYVIEFNAGTVDRLHLHVGDRITIPSLK
jgi:uncharacterized membrane protein (UPF0127 family)